MLEHHAYYIEDSLSKTEIYAEAVRVRGEFPLGGARFVASSHEVFSIDEARALQSASSLKVGESGALFFIATSSISHEAQQALLKLFEEPQAGLMFVLLVPHGTLLPTLRSRLLVYPHKLETKSPLLAEAKTFLASSYKTRSEWLTKFLKAGKEEEENMRTQALDFMNALEAELYPYLKTNRDAREGLADIAHFRGYLSDRSPSLKMIFEHLAATLPKIT